MCKTVNFERVLSHLSGGLGVHLNLLADLHRLAEVTAVVLEALEGATAGLLGLLLLGDLGGLVLDLTGTSEGSVDLTHFFEALRQGVNFKKSIFKDNSDVLISPLNQNIFTYD
jgi:hypothetical protein